MTFRDLNRNIKTQWRNCNQNTDYVPQDIRYYNFSNFRKFKPPKLESIKEYDKLNNLNNLNNLNKPPIPRVGAVLRIKNSILQNKDEPLMKYMYLFIYQHASGYWGFPKGQINERENYYMGALRELNEETGIILENGKFEQRYEKIFIKKNKHNHSYFLFDINYIPTINIDNYEVTNYKWGSLNWLKKQPISFFTNKLIETLEILEELDNN
jgi:bis(5'-nucleosidyl)-tetraphosphatase